MIGYTFRGDNYVKIDCDPSVNRVYSKMKEFAPIWSKFFPLRIDLWE